jgi:hypothetical protein
VRRPEDLRAYEAGNRAENQAVRYAQELPYVRSATRLKTNRPYDDVDVAFVPDAYFAPLLFGVKLEVKSSNQGVENGFRNFRKKKSLAHNNVMDALLEQKIAIMSVGTDKKEFQVELEKQLMEMREFHLRQGENNLQKLGRILCECPNVYQIRPQERGNDRLKVTLADRFYKRDIWVAVNNHKSEIMDNLVDKDSRIAGLLAHRIIKGTVFANTKLEDEQLQTALTKQINFYLSKWF